MQQELIREVFVSLPAIRIKRMFGGQGIYNGERIVAVVIGGDLHLKSDEVSEPDYEAAGLRRWTYQRDGRAPVKMPYYRAPEDIFDDPDVAARWVAIADGASLRSPTKAGGGRRPHERRRIRSTGLRSSRPPSAALPPAPLPRPTTPPSRRGSLPPACGPWLRARLR